MIQIVEYLDLEGHSPFAHWFDGLDPQSAAKVAVAVSKMEKGVLSNLKGVGGGVMEFRIDFGPGYRVYLGRDGDKLVVLLAGGTKQRQNKDIETARMRWADYKSRKKEA